MRTWSLDPDMNIGEFTYQQKEYLRYHQEDVFRGNK